MMSIEVLRLLAIVCIAVFHAFLQQYVQAIWMGPHHPVSVAEPVSALKGLMVAMEVAERQRDAARQGVQNARAAHQAAQGQMEQLQGYANETEGRWGMRADATVAEVLVAEGQQVAPGQVLLRFAVPEDAK